MDNSVQAETVGPVKVLFPSSSISFPPNQMPPVPWMPPRMWSLPEEKGPGPALHDMVPVKFNWMLPPQIQSPSVAENQAREELTVSCLLMAPRSPAELKKG